MGLMMKQINKRTNHIPTTFLGLQKRFLLLQPIHSRSDYNKALKVASELASRTRLTKAQADYLDVLAQNIKIYEDKHLTAKKHTPLEILNFLISENGMTGSSLGRILGQRTLGPAILNGKRSLSKAIIRKLANHFSVEPSLFL